MFTMLMASLAVAAPVPAQTPDWVTLKGTVVWPEKEKIPEVKAIDLTLPRGGDIEYIRTGGAVFNEKFVIDEKTRGLKNMVVSLRPDDDDPKAKFPAERIHPELAKAKPATHTVTSEFVRFDKRVVAARAGDSLEFVNAGKVTIAPRLVLGDEDTCLTIPYDGKPMVVKDLKAGAGHFRDMVHQGWLNATLEGFPPIGGVRVFDHPYFALTNEKGEFEIKQVPKGKWRIVYLHHESGWHKGKDGRLGFPVEVEGNKDGVMTMNPLAYDQPKR
jgi:hypothetical protein